MAKGKRISEDEIKYIVSAETSRAQEEIHALTKETYALRKEERARRKQLIELEAQGKKNTKEYTNLAKECKEYTQKIAENNKKIEEQRKKLDVGAMSMVQLKKQAKDLRTQMDNLSEALNPKEYAELEGQLQKVNRRMEELRVGTKGLWGIAQSGTTMGMVIANVITGITSALSKLLGAMGRFAWEGAELAATADGVKHAFAELDDGRLLDNLRRATKGTVTDLELMKAAVKAKDFRIPLEDMGKYLQFAQLKAQQTGQSVDYMTDSIVTGLGRKSVMILDNLGISAASISAEMGKTGDFMKAVANIVDRELAAAGGSYVSAADRITQKSVELQNAQLQLGEALLPLKEQWEDAYGGMRITLAKATKWAIENKGVLLTLITTVGSYIAVKKLSRLVTDEATAAQQRSIVADKLKAIQLGITTKAKAAYSTVVALLTGKIKLATLATQMFNKATKANLLGLVTSLVIGAVTAFLAFRKKTNEAANAIKELNTTLAVEKQNLNDIFDALKKTNPGTTERRTLIEKLKDSYPGLLKNYNLEKASLKEIAAAQKEANNALVDRIVTEQKAKATSEFIRDNIAGQMALVEELMHDAHRQMGDDVYRILQGSLHKFFTESSGHMSVFWGKYGKFFRSKIGNDELSGFAENYAKLRKTQEDLATGVDKINARYAPYINSLKQAAGLSYEDLKLQMEATSKLKELERERQKVEDTWLESNEQEIIRKNKKLEALDNEIKRLRETGTTKATDKEKKKEKKEDTALLKKEKTELEALEQQRASMLQKLEQQHNDSVEIFNLQLMEKSISQEEHELWLLQQEKVSAENRLKVEQDFLQQVQALDHTHSEQKEELVTKQGQRVLDAEKKANAARLEEHLKFEGLIPDFKKQFIKTTVAEDHQAQLEALKTAYQARKQIAEQAGKDTLEIDAAYLRAKEQLEMEFEEKANQVRSRYGLLTQQQQFDLEKRQLEEHLKEGLITREEYEQALQNLQMESAKKQFDFFHDLFSGAVQALQQAEMDAVDAKYDAEIAAAQGNAEEVERLEKEKEQKKLDIQKKYADVNFAIKASQIIADTAVAITKALAELGPIAGPVAAALMGVTGAAQLAIAMAERNKVKNMTLGGGNSSKGGGQRVATGREKGGKIDVRRAQDGKLFPGADYNPDARGYIDRPTVIVGEGPAGQSKEWVASNAAVENPTVAPILDLIDRSQRAGNIRTLDLNQAIRANMAGYASGGSIAGHPAITPTVPAAAPPMAGTALPPEMMRRLANAIIRIDEQGVKAPVVLSELERKQELRDRSRKIGSKR